LQGFGNRSSKENDAAPLFCTLPPSQFEENKNKFIYFPNLKGLYVSMRMWRYSRVMMMMMMMTALHHQAYQTKSYFFSLLEKKNFHGKLHGPVKYQKQAN
jgi:hypothetical protein